MSHSKFPAQVLTPEGEVFNEEVEMVSTRTALGLIAILARHEPLLAILEPTELRLYRSESEIVRFAQAEGYLQFTGRLKHIIIRGGSNIAPPEVEEAFYHHPAVREAAVAGLPDPLYGQRVAAFVVLREGFSADENELCDFARERLADYKVPEVIRFLPELPKGLTGKVDRRKLAELAS